MRVGEMIRQCVVLDKERPFGGTRIDKAAKRLEVFTIDSHAAEDSKRREQLVRHRVCNLLQQTLDGHHLVGRRASERLTKGRDLSSFAANGEMLDEHRGNEGMIAPPLFDRHQECADRGRRIERFEIAQRVVDGPWAEILDPLDDRGHGFGAIRARAQGSARGRCEHPVGAGGVIGHHVDGDLVRFQDGHRLAKRVLFRQVPRMGAGFANGIEPLCEQLKPD